VLGILQRENGRQNVNPAAYLWELIAKQRSSCCRIAPKRPSASRRIDEAITVKDLTVTDRSSFLTGPSLRELGGYHHYAVGNVCPHNSLWMDC